MIPRKIDVLRKSYTPEVKALLEQVGKAMEDLTPIPEESNKWQLTVHLDRVLTENESFLIRNELKEMGWGSVVQYRSGGTGDDLLIYVVW